MSWKNGAFVPNDWTKDHFNSVVWSRFPHMLLASYLDRCVLRRRDRGLYVLRKEYTPSPASMLRMGLGLAAVLMRSSSSSATERWRCHTYQPAKMAAIEGRWNDEKPAGEVLLPGRMWRTGATVCDHAPGALRQPDRFRQPYRRRNGTQQHPPETGRRLVHSVLQLPDHVAAGGVDAGARLARYYLSFKQRLERNPCWLRLTFLSFPLPFIAILTGGSPLRSARQPWVVTSCLRDVVKNGV